jgi:DNA-binding transcriptional regulator GbsR (MarR family)
MGLKEARQRFVDEWGRLGTSWGVSRTMAQVHALLLTAAAPMDTDQVMEKLMISRGNANMNLRALMDWGLITRTVQPGVRREFFTAEKDIWKVARAIASQRRRRELDPLVQTLQQLADVEASRGDDPAEVRQFQKTVRDIMSVGGKVSRALDLFQKLDGSAFLERAGKLF